MNLLGMLLKVMTAKSAVKQIARKTGLSEKQVKRLMTIAIPILLKYLTKNASSGDGVSSLLGALSQHTNKKEVDLQFKEADEKDGGKIIGHILGKKEPEVTQTLSAQSGLTAEQLAEAQLRSSPLHSTQYPVSSAPFWERLRRHRRQRKKKKTTRSTELRSCRRF